MAGAVWCGVLYYSVQSMPVPYISVPFGIVKRRFRIVRFRSVQLVPVPCRKVPFGTVSAGSVS